MTPETLFDLASPLALAGWAVLVFAPLAPVWADRIAGYAIPLALSVAYTAAILVWFPTAEGGYTTLADVMRLFDFPGVATAGWIHYLAFDLFIGAWEVRRARAWHIPHLAVLPCLALTFLFGPAGLLAFLALAAILRLRSPKDATP